MICKYLLPLAACTVLGLAGCGVRTGPGATAVIPGVALSGTMHGGQQPVANATIQLYAAGATGYNSASTPLLTSTVTTNSQGVFSITSDYTCPASNPEVYIVGTGGNPISGSPANANLALMAALGPCSNLTSSTFININELTTVASVWALAQFMTGYATVGSSASNSAGLAQAFTSVNSLVNVSQGTSPGASLPSNATLNVTQINTIANILAACVNSAGGVAGDGSVCGNLFTTTSVTGAIPTDTIGAAVYMAKHPGNGTTTLFGLIGTTPPFQPELSQAPNNFLIGVTYTGGGLSTPKALAVDSSGDVWVANNANSVTELGPTGTVLSPTAGYVGGGLNAPSAIAVGLDGTIWVANKSGNSVTHLSATGSPLSSSPFSGAGLNAPNSLAIDASGNLWLANSGSNSVSELNSSGSPVSGSSGYTGGGTTLPVAIAVNPF